MQEITKDRMMQIEVSISNLLCEIDFNESPYVDIVSLVSKDGFIVVPQELDIETTGYLLVSEKERIISVNTMFKNPENEYDVEFKKSRFITAHEYGHYILHKEEGEPIYAHRDTYHRTETIELEADYFARSILMPLKQFRLYYEVLLEISQDKVFIVEMLSKVFQVTKNKVNKRIGDLLVLD